MRSLIFSVVLSGLLATCCSAQTTIDYSVLAQPVFANKLNLSDQQRAEVARILDQRVAELVAAAPGDRATIFTESSAKLAALLSDEQQQSLQTAMESGKLQFNFRGQKWSSVLEWFAEQADLSLVMDAEPPGLFTYSDTNEFTPTEAIDLLNSVLLSKNFTLIRRERMLVLADTSDGIPYEIVPQIEVEELARRGRFEIVTVAFPLGERLAATVVEQVTPLIGKHGQVTPMAAAKKLLVTETAGKLQAINVLIASIPEPIKETPKPDPPSPEFTTYPAPGLDAAATIETLQALFPTAQLRFDPNAEEVHSQATPKIQAGVKASIEKMIANVSGDNKPRLQTYTVDAQKLDELVAQLALVHPELQVAADTENGRLLVVADEQGQSDVQATLDNLGVDAKGSDDTSLSVVIHQVDDDSTESLTTLLQEVIPKALVLSQPGRIVVRGSQAEQTLAKNTIDQFPRDPSYQRSLVFYSLKRPLSEAMLSTITSTVPRASITSLAEENRLSVVAGPADHELLAETLAQIEQIQTSEPRELRIYAVTAEQKSRLALIADDLGEAVGTMKMIPDASPTELAAWGNAEQHASLEQLLEQLKTGTQVVLAEAKRLQVTVALPAQLLTLMQERFPNTQMILNEQAETLFVWADDEQFDAIRLEYEKLTAAMPAKLITSLETYDVDPAEAAAIQQNVQSLVPTATISLDSRGGRLIVMASEKDHQEVAAVVEKLSGQSTTSKSVLIAYPLQQGDAQAVVTLLSSIQPSWNLVADTRSNRVLAAAPLAEQPRIQALITQLDSKADLAGETTVASYPFRTLDPATVVTMLQPLFPEMSLTVDVANRQLVASGTNLDHQKLSAAIERVDGRESADKTRVAAYDLGEATADEVQNVLMQLVPSAVISASPNANRVFVWADDQSHEAIAQAIEQLTALETEASHSLRTYPVTGKIGPTALLVFQSMAESASFSLDDSGKNLIAWASESDHRTISDAMDALNQGITRKSDQILRVHRSKTEVVELAKTVLEDLVRDARLVESTSSDSLIVWASPEDHTEIAGLLETLRQELRPAANGQTIAVYSAQDINSDSIETVLAQHVPNASILENDDNRLIVLGTQEEHEQITESLKQLAEAYQPQAVNVLRKHPVRKDVLMELTGYLSNVMPKAIVVDTKADDSLSIWASDAQHSKIDAIIKQFESELAEPSLRIVRVYPIDPEQMTVTALISALDQETTAGLTLQANNETNSLVARGSHDEQERLRNAIETIVGQLPKSSQLVTTVYRFERGSPSAAVNVLKMLIPEASIAADEPASVLVATATADQHNRIAAVVEQIEATDPSVNQSTKIYRFDRASASSVHTAFLMLVPTAKTGYDLSANAVIVTATDEEHAILKEAAEQLEGTPEGAIVKVYPIDKKKIDTETLLASLDHALNSTLAIQENAASNSLIARGSEDDHEQLRLAIDAVVNQLPAIDSPLTEVYPLKLADPTAVARAIATLAPEATIAADPSSGSILVTAVAEDQKRIATVVKQLDVVTGQEPVTKAYPIRVGDPDAISTSLIAAFIRSRDYTITYQEANETVYVIATPRHQETFAEMFASLDVPGSKKELKVYPLKLADPRVIAVAVTDVASGAAVAADPGSNSLLVTGNEQAHATIAEVIKQLDVASGQEPVTKAYPIRVGDPAAISASLTSAFVRSRDYFITYQEANQTVYVIATPRHQETFAEMFASLDVPGSKKELKVYPLKLADPRVVAVAVTDVADGASVAADLGSNSILVTGNEQTHATIAEVIEQLDVASGQEPVTKAYPIRQGDPAAISASLSSAFIRSRDYTITYQEASETVYVIATPRHQATFAEMFASLDVPGSKKELKVYPLKLADPTVIAVAVTDVASGATVAADPGSNSLLVTGNEQTHATIAEVIEQLDVASGQEPVTKAYPIRQGDPDAISESLISAFARSRDYSITYQEANETVYVLATPRHQAAIQDMLQAMDQTPPQRSSQQPKLYPLANVSADVAASTVLAITKGQVPSPDVLPSEESNSLVVVASEEQHRLIQETLNQLDGDVRQLEVFQLRSSDPYTIELAISELFSGLQGASEPFVSSDYGTNKLFVRGTADQLDQIRLLLQKLGESVGGLGQQLGSGKIRQIPFHGDTRAAIRQIEAIWPRIRNNRIQVIVPSESGLRPQIPGGAPQAPADPQDNDQSEERQETSPRPDSAQSNSRSGSKLVVFQNTTRAALPQQSTDDSPDVIVDEDQEQSLPPILIVPGNDSITISSDDSEALDRLESLLRAMSEVHGGIGGNSNFAVFLLRNTGAIEIEVLLKRLFDELPFPRGGIGDAVVVSDERLNALIVHGSVRTREMVAELLEVLDTSELPNPLNVYRPEMISLEHTQASRVMAILENVYRSQLTAVGGRTPLKIPKGIGTSVASILQQMNAAAAGPVLTLEVDQTSNVLIVRAPPELREEIREFVEQIDKQAATQSNRHVRVIQLKESKSDRMLTALQQFLSAE